MVLVQQPEAHLQASASSLATSGCSPGQPQLPALCASQVAPTAASALGTGSSASQLPTAKASLLEPVSLSVSSLHVHSPRTGSACFISTLLLLPLVLLLPLLLAHTGCS